MTRSDFIHRCFVAMLGRTQSYAPDVDFIARKVNECVELLEKSDIPWEDGRMGPHLQWKSEGGGQ